MCASKYWMQANDHRVASTQSFDMLTPRNSRTINLVSISSLCICSISRSAAKEIHSMTDYRVTQGEVQEDQVSAAIERVTAEVPSSIYLAAALTSMAVSVSYKIAKKNDMALFVGQWAAPFLILGIYNKLVKIHGSDGSARVSPELLNR